MSISGVGVGVGWAGRGSCPQADVVYMYMMAPEWKKKTFTVMQ